MSADAPLLCAYGAGVDSTAYLVGLHEAGIRPDGILMANTFSEKQETYDFIPIMQQGLKKVGFPPIIMVYNQVKNFKHWPPYQGLGENCLTNGTLPSLAFGFKSCSLKWKVTPQNAWTDQWQPAIDCWARGGRVRKIIGYDAGPKDMRRYADAKGVEDPKYDYWYPLIDWRMNREDCKELIASAGLPVPPKSACVFCPATRPEELHTHKKQYLRYIVIMEARAAPRLDGLKTQEQLDEEWQQRIEKWKAKHPDGWDGEGEPPADFPARRMQGKGTAGLWRSATKTRPAMMTDYIRQHGLLPSDEIDYLISTVPKEILNQQQMHAAGLEIPSWHDFLEQFTPEDALDEVPGTGKCTNCTMVGF